MNELGVHYTARDLEIADAFADSLHARLKAAGIEVMRGPAAVQPPIWHFRARSDDNDLARRLSSIGLYLTPHVRIRYRAAASEGQGYDDATGYWLRCWAAAFALPFKPAWVSRSAIMENNDG